MIVVMVMMVGCSKPNAPDPDVCKAPTKPPYESQVSLTKSTQMPATQSFVDQENREIDFNFCAQTAAYKARKLRDPMDSVTKGIMATCAVQLEMYQSAKNPLMGHDNDSVAMNQLEREEDEKNKTQETMANVLKYRICSTGQTVPDDLRQ